MISFIRHTGLLLLGFSIFVGVACDDIKNILDDTAGDTDEDDSADGTPEIAIRMMMLSQCTLKAMNKIANGCCEGQFLVELQL